MPWSTMPVVGSTMTSLGAARPTCRRSQRESSPTASEQARARRATRRVRWSDLRDGLSHRARAASDATVRPARPRGTRRRAGSTSPGRSATAATSSGGRERAAQLVGLADRRPGGRAASATKTRRGGPRPTAVVSSLSSPTSRKSGTNSASSSSCHSRRKPAEQVAVARVQVAADADRPAVVEPRVAARPRPAHQEVALAVAQDEVRDDLLEAGSCSIAARGANAAARARRPPGTRSTPVRPDAVPAAARQTVAARHDEDLLLGHRGPPSRRVRGARRRALREARVGSGAALGAAPAPSSQPATRRGRACRSRTRAAIAGPFVAAIPAPIVDVAPGEPRHPAQPLGREAAAVGQSGRAAGPRRRPPRRGRPPRRAAGG